MDAHKGAICDNAVVVVQKSGKNIENPFKDRKNKNFWSKRVILIRNHARNPKKMVPMIKKNSIFEKNGHFRSQCQDEDSPQNWKIGEC